MKPTAATDVLRDVAMHTQPLALARPRPIVLPRPPLEASLPAGPSPAALIAEAVGEGRRAGQAEGFALGREEGRREGHAEGLRLAEQRLDAALAQQREAAAAERDAQRAEAEAALAAQDQRLAQLQDDLIEAVTERLAALESDAVALAFEALCRIVGDDAGRAEQVAGAVRVAMQPLRAGALLKVRVHPEDLRLLGELPGGRALIARTAPVEWIGDAAVVGGGCVLDTRRGSIDARMKVQLGKLRELWSALADAHDAGVEGSAS
jgi:flagellar assembly protein FliH